MIQHTNTKLIVIVLHLACSSFQVSSSVPEWSKTAVWYQIFPERFRNGDTNNDPKVADLFGSWPHDPIGEWQISIWNSDWYKMQPWEVKNGNDFYYNTQLRRYGGDIQGIIDKLDYLSELGVNAIYLNPIFESPSLHKYDATFYHHVDNNFGPDLERDKEIWSKENPAEPTTWKWTTSDSLFLQLIGECHKRNIKIIIDGVFNHVGMTFWAFEDVKKNGEKSEFKNWFTIKQWDDPETEKDEFDYEGWYGVRELPELKEGPDGFDLIIKNHIHAIVRRWMDPNNDGDPSDGIDGWRLDVADMVNINFWREFRKWTREINPESYLVGEVWWEDWGKNKIFDPSNWIQDGDVFDAVMNYRHTVPILNYFTEKNNKISSSEFAKRVTELYVQFPPDVTQVQINTLDSHDTDRLPSIIVNPDRWYDHQASAKDNQSYDVRKPSADEIKIQKLVLLFQFTAVGAPHIYYGDEAGMWGGDDPDGRKPMVWRDIVYEPEATHPFGKQRPRDEVFFDQDLYSYYKKLIDIRKTYPALSVGSFNFVYQNDQADVISYERKLGNDIILICINNSNIPFSTEFHYKSHHKNNQWVNIINGDIVKFPDGNINIELEPKSGVIYNAVVKY
ncbi:MAG: glycoside hydrolase family 13 protein [Bacteroidota bacterium]|nr:glycoside hydrolase family 13 protein [Bacteroidota bacterium]